MEYAKFKGINVYKFNTHARISSRDYYRRIRRAKKIVQLKSTRISLPAPRPSKKLRKDVKQAIISGEIYLGEQIAPKSVETAQMDSSGKLSYTSKNIYGRHFPFDHLRKLALQEHLQLGILNHHSDNDYTNMSYEELQIRYLRIGIDPPKNREKGIEDLKKMERTRYIKVWHDHSAILNHSFVAFTVAWIYDVSNFLTDYEYKAKYPDKKEVDVATLVEKPKLYILGQSGKFWSCKTIAHLQHQKPIYLKGNSKMNNSVSCLMFHTQY